MDRSAFCGRWTGCDFILVDMSMGSKLLDESGELVAEFREILPQFTAEIREDGSFDINENYDLTGRWIKNDDGIGLIPDEDYEKLVASGLSDEEIAMPCTIEDGILVANLGPYIIKFEK